MERSYLTNDNTTCDVVDDFSVEDLLDFSNGDDDGNLESFTLNANSDDSLRDIHTINTCNSYLFYNNATKPHFSAGNKDFGSAISNFSDDLCIQCDDMAELEWLSNFVEEASFSTVDHLVSGTDMSATATSKHPIFNMKTSVPAKARSKRARTAARNWASQLLEASPTSQAMNPTSINISPKIGSSPGPKPKKRKGGGEAVVEANGVVRRCLHCNIDRTPQWRTGPMGPKTLCNACGVRYKSGRLVPEYRPAASPSFMLAKHSNSHRKVMELRRKKENNMQSNHHQQNILLPKFIEDGMIVQVQNPDEYLIHQRVGLDFRQLI